jgi:photosystem II stability/assembly factor-like uncharacterized protein
MTTTTTTLLPPISWTTTIVSGCAETYWNVGDNFAEINFDDNYGRCGTCSTTERGSATATFILSEPRMLECNIILYGGFGPGKDSAYMRVSSGSSYFVVGSISTTGITRSPDQLCTGGFDSNSKSASIPLGAGTHTIYCSFVGASTDRLPGSGGYYAQFYFDAVPPSSSSISQSDSSESFSESFSSSSSLPISSFTSSTSSSTSLSEVIPKYDGVTYYSDFKDVTSINNTLLNNARMSYSGFWISDWNTSNLDLDKWGYGIKKTNNSQGLIYCNDSSQLFSSNVGYLGMVISLPFSVINGIYSPLRGDASTFNEMILWGVNVGQFENTQPGFYASLTPRGIEFTIWTSAGKHTIRDITTNIAANENVFLEFMWKSDFLGHYLVTSIIRVNGIEVASGNAPINNDSLENLKFSLLNTNSSYSNFECTIRKLIIYSKIREDVFEDLQTSSSSSDSSSSSSSYILNWPSSSSSSSSSSYILNWSSSSLSISISESSSTESSSSSFGYSSDSSDSSDSSLEYSSSSNYNLSESSSSEPCGDLPLNKSESPYRSWKGVACSSDGNIVYSGTFEMPDKDTIYKSTDFGIGEWTQLDTPSVENWQSVSCSADGTKVCATVYNAGIYYSTNSGATWTASVNGEVGDNLQKAWWGLACSDNGQYLIASTEYYKTYRSTDYGATWFPVITSGFALNTLGCSASGSVMYAANYSSKKICRSIDYGATWTDTGSPVSPYWITVICSADGARVYAAQDGGNIWASNDSGATWNECNISNTWWWMACSADGKKIYASSEGKIWYSFNFGNTWCYENIYSNGIACTDDGETVFICNNRTGLDNHGYIYLGTELIPI